MEEKLVKLEKENNNLKEDQGRILDVLAAAQQEKFELNDKINDFLILTEKLKKENIQLRDLNSELEAEMTDLKTRNEKSSLLKDRLGELQTNDKHQNDEILKLKNIIRHMKSVECTYFKTLIDEKIGTLGTEEDSD
eukprot:GAHX01000989.1.p1 GENE.GAHX01000989.1~~GAHX01000989.1.p1  ORF type:complete len:136 (-),score=43.39 GAHX01000989.1:1600-2007(-)